MPARVPLRLLFSKLAGDYVRLVKITLRSLVVACLWLVLLPLACSITVRVYNSFAEAIPFQTSRLFVPLPTFSVAVRSPRSSTFVAIPEPLNKNCPEFIKQLMVDVIEGSIIVASMLLVFFVVMIVREWVLQNQPLVEYLRELDGMDHFNILRRNEAERLNILRNEMIRRGINAEGEAGGEAHIDLVDLVADLNIANNEDPLPNDEVLVANGVNEEELDGLQDIIGLRGPLSSIVGTHIAVLIATTVALFLLYLIPYSTGRIITHLIFGFIVPQLMVAIIELIARAYTIIDLSTFPIYSSVGHLLGYSWTWASKETLPLRRAQMNDNIYSVVDNIAVNLISTFFKGPEMPSAPEGVLQHWMVLFKAPLCSDELWARCGITIMGYAAIMFCISELIIPLAERYKANSYYRLFLKVLMEVKVIVKVIFILSIELLVFPVFCGVLLKTSLLPVIESASIASMISSDISRPVFNIFSYWVVGTSYMFLFMLFVTMCRRIMRPGVLFFLRDSNDPDYKPIDEMLEKRLLVQLGKIGISAILYAIIIVMGIGAVAWYIRVISPSLSIFPLESLSLMDGLYSMYPASRLKLASVILFIILMQSYVHIVSAVIRHYWSHVFQAACNVTRLSSFLLNVRKESEMGDVYYRNLYSAVLHWFGHLELDYSQPLADSKSLPSRGVIQFLIGSKPECWYVSSGTFVRAPAIDNLKGNKQNGLFFSRVTSDDEPLEPCPTQTNSGDSEALQPGDYAVVYRPPYFRARVALFIFFIWLFSFILSIALSVCPILLGRAVVAFFAKSSHLEHLHASRKLLDLLFSFSIGGMVMCSMCGALHLLLNRQKATAHLFSIRNWVRNLGIALLALVGIPCVIGILLDQYILSPAVSLAAVGAVLDDTDTLMRILGSQATSGTLFSVILYQRSQLPAYLFLHTVFGLVVLTIGKYILQITHPAAQILVDYNALTANGFLSLDRDVFFTRFMTWGSASKAFALLFVPPMYAAIGVIIGIRQYGPLVLCQWSYPLAALMYLYFQVSKRVAKLKRGWENTVRDKLYLVGQRLENIDS